MYGVELSAIQSYLPARSRTFAVITHMTLSSSEIPLNPLFQKGEVMKIRTRGKNSQVRQLRLSIPLFEKACPERSRREGLGETCLDRRATSIRPASRGRATSYAAPEDRVQTPIAPSMFVRR